MSARDRPSGLVWVTRAEPGASATAERLRALGLDPLVSPVLEVRPLDAEIALEGAAALAFTSANAVRAFADRERDRALPVFAVGEATAQAARDAGFAAVEPADGDVAALAQLIAARRPGLVLNPTAAEPAADLAALLAAEDVPARPVALYETVPADPVAALGALDQISTVLVHSPKAARRLAALLDPAALSRLDFACISEAAARPLLEAGARQARFAPAPAEAALLELLQPPEPEGPFRVMDARFWVALAFGVLCLIAAGVVALLGPKIWPKAPPHAAPAASGPSAPSGRR